MKNNTRERYQDINQLRDCSGPVSTGLRDENNNYLADPVDIVRKFKEHFDSILNTGNKGISVPSEYQSAEPLIEEGVRMKYKWLSGN